MLEIFYTEEFHTQFKSLPLSIKKKFGKQLSFFRKNPSYPSLQMEKLQPKDRGVWSFRVDRTYRVLFRYLTSDKVLLLTIGHHGWIYRFG